MTEEIVIQIDDVQKRLPKLAKQLDQDVRSGKDSRDLHDFIQDELLPTFKMVADDVRTLAELVSEHDEAIADLAPENNGSQLEAEHAASLIEHLEFCNQFFDQLVKAAAGTGQDMTTIQQRMEVGNALVEFIKSVTMEEDEEEEVEEDAETTKPGRQN